MGKKGVSNNKVLTELGMERRRNIMVAIKNYIDTKGYAPTFREVGKTVNLSSTSTVHNHIKKLLEEGYISMEKGSSRSIRVLKDFD
jgi:repressor LexA